MGDNCGNIEGFTLGMGNALTALHHADGIVNTVRTSATNAYNQAVSTISTIQGIIGQLSASIGDLNCPGGSYDGGDVTSFLGPVPTPPSLGDLTPPDIAIVDYNETWFWPELKTLLDQKLYDEISNGSTGLTEAVLDDMFNWQGEKNRQALEDAKARIAADWAFNNAVLPEAVLKANQAWADIKYAGTLEDTAREKRSETEKIAIENSRFVKELAVKWEDVIWNYVGGYWQRKVNYAIGVMQYGNLAYDYVLRWKTLLVELYRARCQGYGAMARVADAQARVEAAELDAKSRFDAAQCGAQADRIRAEVARVAAQVDAAVAAIAGVSRVGAALAAGAMSAIQAGANISYDGRVSESKAQGEQRSCVDYHYTSHGEEE